MDNFNLNLFKYFYYVVIYNGVTNASKNLKVAQPSLSLSIKKLESELNKVLINRSSKQFQLTDDGHRLFETLKPALESMEKNIDFSSDDKKYLELNIGIRYSYANSILSEFIKIFQYEYPKVKLNIDLYSKLNFDKINNKEYDIIIDDDDYIKQSENINIEKLCEIENYFVCGNKLIEEYRNVKSIQELDTVPFICYRPSLKSGKFKQFCYQNDISFFETININESDLYFKLIRDNLGIGFSNKLLLKEFLNAKTLYKLNVEQKLFNDKLSIAYTKNEQIVYNFIKLLKKYIAEELE